MNNIISQYEQFHISQTLKKRAFPRFRVGDTLRVSIRVADSITKRYQLYEGVVIAKKNRGLSSSFVVRKISHGEGVERRFLIYSPILAKIDVVKYGLVRRAKLFYLRSLSGKASRIPERKDFS